MPRYSIERKEAVLKKLVPPMNLSVAEVARQEGIAEQTLYNWRNKLRSEGKPVPGKTKTSEQWSNEAKLSAVIETAALNETELSEYCRKNGLYPEQVKAWKQDCLTGVSKAPAKQKADEQQAKKDKKRIRQLEKELNRKEKALAESAALLVLRKKLNAFYEGDSEDD
jgi:transposase-like protein